MTRLLIAAMPGEIAPAERLATRMQAEVQGIDIHHFPDGESRVRALSAAKTSILYCSLDRPNKKLVELAFAASALRDLGAQRLVLVAPYLCYMRQDAAFEKGDAVSQRVIGRMLSNWFDRVVTIEPHLHRTRSLDEIIPDTETSALSAASLLAGIINQNSSESADNLIVGPDIESQKWAEAVASQVAAECTVLEKNRTGDNAVSIRLAHNLNAASKRVFLVDDIASTGETLAAAARLMKSKCVEQIYAVVAHALFDETAYRHMQKAGITRVFSTDSVAHPTNACEVSSLLAEALLGEIEL